MLIQPLYIMLVGLPGSGKTTYRTGLLEGFLRRGVVPPRVASTDDLIEHAAQDEGTTYNEAWPRNIARAEREMKADMRRAFERGHDIVHDQTNTSARKRRECCLDATAFRYFKACILVEIDHETRMMRLKTRAAEEGKSIPAEVDADMRARFVYPDLSEGWDYIGTAAQTSAEVLNKLRILP